MHKDENIDLSVRKYTSRLIVERARARGWHVYGFDSNPAIYLLDIPGKKMPVKIFSASPAQMSFPVWKVSCDKYVTNQILDREGIPVPADVLVNTAKPLEKTAIKDFLQKYKTIVVKPLDASHGNGITMNVSTLKQLNQAIKEAGQHTKKDSIVIQQQIEGNDLRILCINYKFVAAITRTPARIKGDGKHTIDQLIDIENSQDYRGDNYKSRLNYINKEKAKQYLGKEQINQIPSKDQIVRVMGVANIGMGGERKVITNDIPDFLIKIALKAAKIMEVPVCAVDFIVTKDPQKNHTQDDLKPYLIEINGCPQLLISDDPHSKEQSDFIDKYLDYVAQS